MQHVCSSNHLYKQRGGNKENWHLVKVSGGIILWMTKYRRYVNVILKEGLWMKNYGQQFVE